jgi:hypothetical protein
MRKAYEIFLAVFIVIMLIGLMGCSIHDHGIGHGFGHGKSKGPAKIKVKSNKNNQMIMIK